MAYFAAILFFTLLLVALATILDLMVRADWERIAAALRGPARARAPAARPAQARPAARTVRWHAAS